MMLKQSSIWNRPVWGGFFMVYFDTFGNPHTFIP